MRSRLCAIHYTEPLTAQERALLLSHLGSDSKFRVERLFQEGDRDRTLLGEILAKFLLSKETQREISEIEFKRNRYGKPEWPSGERLFFNISHSGAWVICGIASVPIGVDVEKIREVSFDLCDQFMTLQEKRHFHALPKAEKLPQFFRYWTVKESYMKAVGKGFSLSPLTFFLEFFDDKTISISGDIHADTPKVGLYDLDVEHSLSAVTLGGVVPEAIEILELDDIFKVLS